MPKGGTGKEDGIGSLFDEDAASLDHGEGLGDEISTAEGDVLLKAYAKKIPVRDWAGELLSEQDLHDRFHVSDGEINTWKAGGSVVVLVDDEGKLAFPVDQFINGRPVKGLAEITETIGNPRVAWMWLRQPHAVFEARQPLEVLKMGSAPEVVQAAIRDFR